MKGFNRRDVIQNAATLSMAGALIGSHVLRISNEAKGSVVTNTNAQAVLDLLPSSAEVGSLVMASGLHSIFDTSPLCSPEFSFDWGDGTRPSGPREIASHTYAVSGAYAVRLVVLTPENGELSTAQTIEITARQTPPADTVRMIDQLTGQISALSFDLELKTVALNLLIIAKQQAQFAQAHRIPVRGTKIDHNPRKGLHNHHAGGTRDSDLSMVRFLGAAHSVIGAQDPLVFANQRGQITDDQLRDLVLQRTGPLLSSLWEEARLQGLEDPGGIIREWICNRGCELGDSIAVLYRGALASGELIGCSALAVADMPILAAACVGKVAIDAGDAARAIAAWRENCYAECHQVAFGTTSTNTS